MCKRPDTVPARSTPADNSVRVVFARSAAARALLDAQRALATGDFARAEACARDAEKFIAELKGAR